MQTTSPTREHAARSSRTARFNAPFQQFPIARTFGIALLLGCTLSAGCSTTARDIAAASPEPQVETGAFRPTTLDEVAARAIEMSRRVDEAAHLLDAARSDRAAASLPPDPSIALSLGIPVDGLGGTAFSASLLTSLGWLFAHDAIAASAQALETEAALMLVVATAETAADARRLARTTLAAEDAAAAARIAEQALAQHVESLEAAVAAGEAGRAGLASARAEAADASITQSMREEALADARARLASLLRVSEAHLELDALAIECGAAGEARASGSPTPDIEPPGVVAARTRLAEARRMRAETTSVVGLDEGAGAGFSRDLEDREAVDLMLTLRAPLFRRGHEIAAADARVAAAEAALEEASRLAAIELAELERALAAAIARRETVEESLASATAALAATDAAVAAGEASRSELLRARADRASRGIASADARIHEADACARLEQRVIATLRASAGDAPHAGLARRNANGGFR
jgi:outer membrane protein TolC